MEKVFRKFNSHAEADAADNAYYASLTGEQRIHILLEMLAVQWSYDASANRLARVYRVVKRGKR